MREISAKKIIEAVEKLCGEAAYNLPDDVYCAMEKAAENEKENLAKSVLEKCLQNADIARKNEMPICQDTGFAVVFAELGENLRVVGENNLQEAVQIGVKRGYEKYYLRKSIVKDPLFNRKNTGDNLPAIVHLSAAAGDKIKITLAPKGGGSENCGALKMLKPSDGERGVIDFVVDTVISAGANPCPPVIVGVGIGGTAEKCAELAKRALLRPLGQKNEDENYAALEEKILAKINASAIGAQGFGGNTTALAVNVIPFATHIACLPVAVAINCHVARHASVVL